MMTNIYNQKASAAMAKLSVSGAMQKTPVQKTAATGIGVSKATSPRTGVDQGKIRTGGDESRFSFKELSSTSVSKDGDTVEVSRLGQTEYEASRKHDDESEKFDWKELTETNWKPAADDTDDVSDSDKGKTITSLAGYTESQLKELYSEGSISKYDYEKELERKEEVKGTDDAADEDGAAGIPKEVFENTFAISDVKRSVAAVESAYSDKSSDVISAKDRVELIDDLSKAPAERERYAAEKRQVSKTVENNFRKWQTNYQLLFG